MVGNFETLILRRNAVERGTGILIADRSAKNLTRSKMKIASHNLTDIN